MLRRRDGPGLFNRRPYRIVGAASHRYRAAPRLSEAEVAAFEVAQLVSLPAGYREWITTVGNGGVGPDEGLGPLAEWDLVRGQKVTQADFLRQAFDSGQGRRGTLCLASHPRREPFLVVSGASAGEVWIDEGGSLAPQVVQGVRVGFFDWMDAWISRSLRELGG